MFAASGKLLSQTSWRDLGVAVLNLPTIAQEILDTCITL